MSIKKQMSKSTSYIRTSQNINDTIALKGYLGDLILGCYNRHIVYSQSKQSNLFMGKILIT